MAFVSAFEASSTDADANADANADAERKEEQEQEPKVFFDSKHAFDSRRSEVYFDHTQGKVLLIHI